MKMGKLMKHERRGLNVFKRLIYLILLIEKFEMFIEKTHKEHESSSFSKPSKIYENLYNQL